MNNELMYTFIVPIYNVEQYLCECIESILVQKTQYSFEIILVDDGSSDSSKSIAEGYAKKNEQIVLIQKKNGGLASARNAGLRKARGKWIIFVDSDDYLDDSFLASVDPYIASLRKNECIIVDNQHLYEDGSVYIEKGLKPEARRTGYIMNDLLPMACGKIISGELIKEQGLLFQEKIYYEDIAWFPYVAIFLEHYIYIEKPLYIYRQRMQSISHDRNLQKMQDAIYAVESSRRRLWQAGKIRAHYEEYEFYVINFALTHMCAEVIEVDPKSETARKILRYVKKHFPSFENNIFISSMSTRNRVYLWLIQRKKFILLHNLICVKRTLKNLLKIGMLQNIYFWYKKHAI